MGKIKQGILGGFSGKVGNVVGSSWKGIAVMKALPLSVANPKTASQVINRSKFSGVSKLGSQLLGGLVKPFWDKTAQQQSGFNVFVSTNVIHFNDNGIPILPDLIMSEGNIGEQEITNIVAARDTDTCSIEWDETSLPQNALATDNATMVVIDADNEVLGIKTDLGKDRTNGSISTTLTRNLVQGETIGAYLTFKRADGSSQADSYGEAVVIP